MQKRLLIAYIFCLLAVFAIPGCGDRASNSDSTQLKTDSTSSTTVHDGGDLKPAPDGTQNGDKNAMSKDCTMVPGALKDSTSPVVTH